MPGLFAVLSELAVPVPGVGGELAAFGDGLLKLVDPTELGDARMVADAAAQRAPEFIALAEAAARARSAHADALLAAAAAALPTLTNLVFLDSADIALNSPHLLQAQGRALALALYDRVVETKASSGLQAYAYLETLTRLGLTDSTARFRLLEYLTTFGLDDPEDMLERLPKLIGLALDRWRETGLRDGLRLLLEHDVTRADAAYELAQVTLREALEEATIDGVLSGLTSARDQFTTIETMEEAREDATLYRCALDLTVAFVGGGSQECEATATLEKMNSAIAQRAAMTTRTDLGSWAAPRRQAEVEWLALARTLRLATAPLREPSWNAPRDTLVLILSAYRASRSITVMTGDGLRVVLEPTVEAAFLRYDGLLNHLQGLTEEEDLPENELEVARRLLDVVTATASQDSFGGDAVGKARAAAPDLAAELGSNLNSVIANELIAASESAPNLLRALEVEARARARFAARESDPIVDDLLEDVLSGLENCPGLTGTASDEFTELLTHILKFAADRANIGRMNGGPDVQYLFEPKDGKAFTESFLQRDVANWLRSTQLRRFVEMEQNDVAAGRADVTVTQTHKITIEIKRELLDVSAAALLKAYGGQAAAYSVTGPAVSLEMVLDLTDQSRGTPSIRESVWVQKVPISGGKPRRVVTIVIHGNRRTPRQMKAQ